MTQREGHCGSGREFLREGSSGRLEELKVSVVGVWELWEDGRPQVEARWAGPRRCADNLDISQTAVRDCEVTDIN